MKLTLEDAQKKILEVSSFSEKLGDVLGFLLKEIQVLLRIRMTAYVGKLQTRNLALENISNELTIIKKEKVK
jgi:hypothetical protein